MRQIANHDFSKVSVVSYVTPTFDLEVLNNAKNKSDLDRHILSQTQGESVLLNESYDIPSLLYISHVIYSSSPELVFLTKDGLKIQIFDFTSSPVIRPSGIILSFSVLNKEVISVKSTKEIRINVQDIWEKETSKNIEFRIYSCMQHILKQALNTNKTILIGKEPAVIFLLTQHALSTRTKEMWYQTDLGSKAVRIY